MSIASGTASIIVKYEWIRHMKLIMNFFVYKPTQNIDPKKILGYPSWKDILRFSNYE